MRGPEQWGRSAQAHPLLAPLVPAAELEGWSRSQHRAGRSIVFTNGCFDLLHEGHVRSLLEAAALGDLLLVAINSDASVRRIKGKGRPIVPEGARALALRALRPVGAVTIFEASSSLPTILTVRPDVLAKGGQYRDDEIVGGREVTAWGGRVVRLPMVDGISTTRLLEELRSGPAGSDPSEGKEDR